MNIAIDWPHLIRASTYKTKAKTCYIQLSRRAQVLHTNQFSKSVLTQQVCVTRDLVQPPPPLSKYTTLYPTFRLHHQYFCKTQKSNTLSSGFDLLIYTKQQTATQGTKIYTPTMDGGSHGVFPFPLSFSRSWKSNQV